MIFFHELVSRYQNWPRVPGFPLATDGMTNYRRLIITAKMIVSKVVLAVFKNLLSLTQ